MKLKEVLWLWSDSGTKDKMFYTCHGVMCSHTKEASQGTNGSSEHGVAGASTATRVKEQTKHSLPSCIQYSQSGLENWLRLSYGLNADQYNQRTFNSPVEDLAMLECLNDRKQHCSEKRKGVVLLPYQSFVCQCPALFSACLSFHI